MRTPWEWCVESLKKDRDTRQAILRFNLPENCWLGNKDVPCTMHGAFQIREDRLNLSIVMRSQDMVKGAVYDWNWFISLIEKMVEELKPTYPQLQIGSFSSIMHSVHIYEKDLMVVEKMLGRNISTNKL
jgi:thymidylate synthase